MSSRRAEASCLLIGATYGQVKVFVDAAPVMEKPYRIGRYRVQGKHTNLVSREFVLAERSIFTTPA
jgi:hypothetical protein